MQLYIWKMKFHAIIFFTNTNNSNCFHLNFRRCLRLCLCKLIGWNVLIAIQFSWHVECSPVSKWKDFLFRLHLCRHTNFKAYEWKFHISKEIHHSDNASFWSVHHQIGLRASCIYRCLQSILLLFYHGIAYVNIRIPLVSNITTVIMKRMITVHSFTMRIANTFSRDQFTTMGTYLHSRRYLGIELICILVISNYSCHPQKIIGSIRIRLSRLYWYALIFSTFSHRFVWNTSNCWMHESNIRSALTAHRRQSLVIFK